jgi:hypothetical protein
MTTGLILAIACACGGGPNAELTAQPGNVYVKDIPVPQDFKINEDESRSRTYPDKNIRDMDFVFEGRDHKLAVRRFYEKNMELNRWALKSSRMIQGRIIMQFEKDRDECVVAVEDVGVFGTTRIDISIKPKGGG